MDYSWLFDFADPMMWISFALICFFGVLVYFKIPATIAGALDGRADKIRDELDQARSLREEAQELLASYTRKQRAAEKEAEAIITQAKADAQLYASETRAKLNEQLERRAETAKHRIEQAQNQAETLVRNQAIELAVKAVEIALDTTVPKTAKAKLIDDGIKEMSSGL